MKEVQKLLCTSVNINSRTKDVSDLGAIVTFHCLHCHIQNGFSALLLASLRGHAAVVKLLIRAGATVDLVDKVS